MSDSGPNVVFLTGCASGIGKHLAKSLVGQGHVVVCTDIDLDGVEAWLADTPHDDERVWARALDVCQPDQWDEVIQETVNRFGSLDVMMNIAGYLNPGYCHESSLADIDRHVDVNIKGVMYGTRRAARQMVEQADGHIINIGSLASLTPVPGLSLYGASKFAVRGFSLSVAEELRPHGVDVSVVLLDAVRTPMLDLQAGREEAALTFSGPSPLTVEDVEQLIFEQVLPNRPLEVTLPKSRGLIARMAGVAPDLTRLLSPILTRLGKRAQKDYEPSVQPGER